MVADESGSGLVSFERCIGVDPRVELLAANELEILAEKSIELADLYARAAALLEDEEERQVALGLSNWRRSRGLYFRELSADIERKEAEQLERAGDPTPKRWRAATQSEPEHPG